MSCLTSYEALELTANFAFTAERMRAADADFQARANLYETASRIAFLKAHMIARDEEIRPVIGQACYRAVFAIA
jgi:hypothetical protein